MSTVPQLAKQMHESLERRESGDKRQEYFLKEGSPQWMRDVVFAASDNTSFYTVYDFVNEAVGVIADCEDDEDEIRDAINEIEADVYTAELTAWLAENVNHVNFISDVLSEFGEDIGDGFQLLAAAQAEHKHQVANAVYEALKALADGEEDDDGDDPDVPQDDADLDAVYTLLNEISEPLELPQPERAAQLTPADYDYDGLNDTNTYPRENGLATKYQDSERIRYWIIDHVLEHKVLSSARQMAYDIVGDWNYQRWLPVTYTSGKGVTFTVPAPATL